MTVILQESIVLSVRKAYLFDPKDIGNGLIQIDISGVSGFSNNFTAAFSDPLTDVLYFVHSPDKLASWNTSVTNLQFTWKSKVYELPYATVMEAAEVRARDFDGTVTFTLYNANGTVIYTKSVSSEGEFVVAPGVTQNIQMEVIGTSRIRDLIISNDMSEL